MLLFLCIRLSPDDYFRYEFYKKSHYERNRFITYRRSQRIICKYNDKSQTSHFSDKRQFNKTFADFIKREWLDLNSCTEEEFISFANSHMNILLKPLDGGQGKGIFKLTAEQVKDLDLSLYRHYIAEEILVQHPEMAQLNASSVNTIRVLTFRGRVIACALRIGGCDAIVDNLHSNGICAHLDRESGIVDALCIDNSMNKYLFHPHSGMLLVGFQVPCWQRLLDTVTEASRRVPDVRYVGWDVAILENDVAIIEGNHDPGHDVVQMIAQTGLFEEIMGKEC